MAKEEIPEFLFLQRQLQLPQKASSVKRKLKINSGKNSYAKLLSLGFESFHFLAKKLMFLPVVLYFSVTKHNTQLFFSSTFTGTSENVLVPIKSLLSPILPARRPSCVSLVLSRFLLKTLLSLYLMQSRPSLKSTQKLSQKYISEEERNLPKRTSLSSKGKQKHMEVGRESQGGMQRCCLGHKGMKIERTKHCWIKTSKEYEG